MDWKQYLKKELQREKYISKNDVAQSYILKIGKLNKGTITYVVEQLRFKKMEVQNKLTNHIVKDQSTNIHKYVSGTFVKLIKDFNGLENKLGDYKGDKEKLERYQLDINDRKKK
ncbi:unnamed protein product [Plasmodium vivax]|uniref:(malaria parasite P. vivax) hypothetical protein n=1 Tax=Plasmodium vivax TaxID=5855 RepID=A0A8S4HDA0_PLAVI|nr:unnamed protein product [Plasmodium vivax]